ncbi:hypothetical protein RJ641_005950 [Dillenia turbinata]|uniref:Uncharacterized protein n=1 Tax=Dillenia turbinata TaxID=194707 RepID=A0AAN8Z5L7_9MAGN
MAAEIKPNVLKIKNSSSQLSPAKPKPDLSVTKKKLETSPTKSNVDSNHKSVSSVSKSEVKEKTTPSSSKTTTTTTKKTTTKVREKKVYNLPGQKYDVPEEREPLRIFYESLSKQIPSSEMAELMEHGLLSPEKAKKAYEKKQKKQKQQRMGTPMKSSPPGKLESPQKQQQESKNGNVKAKKRIMDDEDDDFKLSPKKRRE